MKEERKESNGWEMNYRTNPGEHWLQIQSLVWHREFSILTHKILVCDFDKESLLNKFPVKMIKLGHQMFPSED